MKADPRMPVEPFADGRRLVGADVVEHDRELSIGIGSLNLSQEGEEVCGGMASPGLCRHPAGGDFKSGKEMSGAVALVVVVWRSTGRA